MANKSAKLTTGRLEAKLLLASGSEKDEILEVLNKRKKKVPQAVVDGLKEEIDQLLDEDRDHPVEDQSSDDQPTSDEPSTPSEDFNDPTFEDQPTAKLVIDEKDPYKGRVVKFTTRIGHHKIQEPVVKSVTGKRDGKLYLVVKHHDKLYYKQEKDVTFI